MQEAYRLPRSKYSLCCPMPGGVPHPWQGGTPSGTPLAWLEGTPSWVTTPSWPGWRGVPWVPHLSDADGNKIITKILLETQVIRLLEKCVFFDFHKIRTISLLLLTCRTLCKIRISTWARDSVVALQLLQIIWKTEILFLRKNFTFCKKNKKPISYLQTSVFSCALTYLAIVNDPGIHFNLKQLVTSSLGFKARRFLHISNLLPTFYRLLIFNSLGIWNKKVLLRETARGIHPVA